MSGNLSLLEHVFFVSCPRLHATDGKGNVNSLLLETIETLRSYKDEVIRTEFSQCKAKPRCKLFSVWRTLLYQRHLL